MSEEHQFIYIVTPVDIERIDDDEVRKMYSRSLNAYGMNSPGNNFLFELQIEHLEFVESFEVWLANPFAQRFVDAPPWDCFRQNIPFKMGFYDGWYFLDLEEARMAAVEYSRGYTDDGTAGRYAVIRRVPLSRFPRARGSAQDYERLVDIYRYNWDAAKCELVDRDAGEFDELAEAIYHHFQLGRLRKTTKNYTWV